MRHHAVLIAALSLPVAANAAAPITGQWLTDDGKAIVTISPCGAGVCGHVTKVLKPNPNGPTVDRRNPDPAKRNRPIEGMQILANMADSGSDWRGKIYSPEAGREYSSYLSRKADGNLQVKGCVAFFCQTKIWKPVR